MKNVDVSRNVSNIKRKYQNYTAKARQVPMERLDLQRNH